MSNSMLAYDGERVLVLARRTSDSIAFLDATRWDDPAAVEAMISLRNITHHLGTVWVPTLMRVGTDTSMTGWNAATGFAATRVTGSDTADGDLADTAESDPADLADLTDAELLALLDPQQATGGPPSSGQQPTLAMLEELARRWDELDPAQQQAALLDVLAWDAMPGEVLLLGAQGPLSFLPTWLEETALDPQFAASVVDAVAAGGPVPIALQPLVDAVGADYRDTLVAAVNGIDDPNQIAGLGLVVPFTLDRATATAFVDRLSTEGRRDIEQTVILDTAGLTLGGSMVARDPQGTTWNEAVGHEGATVADYEGGGFVIGPDGRSYPIVIPTVTTGAGTFTADAWTAAGQPSVAELGGEDEGWQVIGYAAGDEQIQASAGVADYVLGGLAASGGLVQPALPTEGLAYIVMSPNGPPRLSATPPTLPTTANTPDADGVPLIAADVATLALNLDNGTQRAFQVVLEQNDDGRVRARVEAYSLWATDGGEILVVPQHLYITPDGVLMNQGVSYGAPFATGDHIAGPPGDIPAINVEGYDFNAFAVPGAIVPAP